MLADLNSDGEWVTYDESAKTAKITSIADFAKNCKTASDIVVAFDPPQGVNPLFGIGDGKGCHFDKILADVLTDVNSEYAANYYSDFKKEIEQGERKYMGDVVGSIVSDQVYKISGKQFKATYEAVIEWNQKHPDRAIDLGEGANEKSVFYQMKVRTMDFSDEDSEWSEWFDIIREKREELFKQGKSAKEVRKEISRTFYGSK